MKARPDIGVILAAIWSGVVVAGGVFGGVVFLAGLDVAIAALVRDPVKFLQSFSGVVP